jgi:peptide/nickel transport system substrate-binding protein
LPGYIDPLYFTNFWTPLPRHLYGGLSPTEIADSPEANRNPPGWGPFVLREWVSGDHLTFERNPHYFRAAEGLPWADRVTYRLISDPALLADELRAGRCDLAPQGGALEAISEGANEARVVVVSGTTLEHLDFGIAPAPDYAREVGNEFFQDRRARQALAHCLDRVALTPNRASKGGESLAAYLSTEHPWRAPDVAPYPFDPAQGRALLAELGWTDTGGDGTLDKDGAPLKLTLVTGPIGDIQRESVAGAIRDQLRENCGVEIEIRLLTRGELVGDWPDGVVFGRRFDLALFGWAVGSAPPCELFTMAQIPGDANPGGANDVGYSHPGFDAACRRAVTTLDPRQAAPYHAEAQRIFAQDLPMLPLFFHVKIAAARPEVQGFALDPSSATELWNIEALSLVP